MCTVQSGNIAHIKLWWSFVTLAMSSHKKHNQTCFNTSLKINSVDKMPLRMIFFQDNINLNTDTPLELDFYFGRPTLRTIRVFM